MLFNSYTYFLSSVICTQHFSCIHWIDVFTSSHIFFGMHSSYGDMLLIQRLVIIVSFIKIRMKWNWIYIEMQPFIPFSLSPDILFISIMHKQIMIRMRNLFNCVYLIFFQNIFFPTSTFPYRWLRVFNSRFTCTWWIRGRGVTVCDRFSLSLKFNVNGRVVVVAVISDFFSLHFLVFIGSTYSVRVVSTFFPLFVLRCSPPIHFDGYNLCTGAILYFIFLIVSQQKLALLQAFASESEGRSRNCKRKQRDEVLSWILFCYVNDNMPLCILNRAADVIFLRQNDCTTVDFTMCCIRCIQRNENWI